MACQLEIKPPTAEDLIAALSEPRYASRSKSLIDCLVARGFLVRSPAGQWMLTKEGLAATA